MQPVEPNKLPRTDTLCSRLSDYFAEIRPPAPTATPARAISTALSRKAKYGAKGLSKEAQTKLENRNKSNGS